MLSNFEFQGNQVRVVLVNGEPWFVGTDICEILEITNASDVYKRLKDYEKGVDSIETLGGNQKMVIISESGLYRIILTSRKPKAEPFQDWVCQEVLRSIRKTGGYSVQQQPVLPVHEVALMKARAIAEIDEILCHQPRLAQFLIDHTISDLMGQKLIGGTVLRGVVEIAEDMKLPVNINNRCALGKFVKAQLPHLVKTEERLVNGTIREVCCYPDTDEVRSVIELFFHN